MVHRRGMVAWPIPRDRGRHAGGMKLHGGPAGVTAPRLRHRWVADTPFRMAGGRVEVIGRTIVRSCPVFRGQSCDLTFICLANPLFFNWNCVCIHCNAKSLFDKRKPIDRGLVRTYSGAKWQKVGQSGLDLD